MDGTVLGFNRELAKEVGVSAALLFQELRRKHHYWQSQGKLNENGEFWCDQKSIGEWILLHPNNVGAAANKLVEAGLIQKRTSYRPNSTTPTTWWKVLISEINETVISSNQRNSDYHNKTNTEADTVEEITEDDPGMRPEVLYTRVHSMFKGPHEMKKQKIEAIRQLKEEFSLSDDTILTGFREIANNPSFTTKDGSTVTWNLSMLLLRNDIEKTARFLVQKAEQSGNSSKEERWNPYADQ